MPINDQVPENGKSLVKFHCSTVLFQIQFFLPSIFISLVVAAPSLPKASTTDFVLSFHRVLKTLN